MSDQHKPSMMRLVLHYVVSALVCLLILGAAVGALYWIYSSEPTAQREGATRKSAALVDTLVVERGTYEPDLVVLGNVQPSREIQLSPLVGGEIIKVDPSFEPGGIVAKNQPLLEIDSEDYRNVITLRESELKQAQAELAIEEGRQAVARKELDALGLEITPANRALVLREPQIDSIKARIASAQSMLDQATLDLKRTSLIAPFDAQIMSRLANLGSQVEPGQSVARLVGIDTYWVIASVPLRQLKFITFEEAKKAGSTVEIRLKSVWGPGELRTGVVTRLIGELDPQARLAQVLITVGNPLALQNDDPPLILDSIVQARIKTKPLEAVVRLPREHLRQNNTVWVFDEGKLAIRKVQIAFGNADYVYVSEGLSDDDEIVITALATVSEGRPLRRSTDQDDAEQADAEGGE